jgi:cystathionine beta-lyase
VRPDTELVRFDAAPGDPHRPAAPPLYQTATFAQEGPEAHGRYDYTRSGNPTRDVLEAQLARVERAQRAFAFASGMAAITAATGLLRAGDEIVAGDDLYGGTWRLLSRVLSWQGVAVRYADATDPDALEDALGPRTRMVWVETPTNPLQRVVDLRATAEITRRRGVLLAVDGSTCSPALQLPLEHGADLVVHSATKWLCGHGDVIAGVVAVRDPDLAERIAFLQNATGNALAPFDAWLLLRGLKTLSLRVERQQASARRVAQLLSSHPAVAEVLWPGLPEHPGHAVHARQSKGPGAVVSFRTGSVAASEAVVRALRLFTIAVSFGSVASSVTMPCRSSHASIPEEVRRARAFPEDLVRLSIGIEDPEDLLEDVAVALSGAMRAAV